jgi:hypothetical protein
MRRPALVTMRAVLTELARQYRRADRGEMDWQDTAAAARILREIRQAIERIAKFRDLRPEPDVAAMDQREYERRRREGWSLPLQPDPGRQPSGHSAGPPR